MKYLSIDIETTGLDPNNNQILSVGVVVEDTNKKLPIEELPKFHCAIVREEIRGGLFALNMNKELISLINEWDISGEEIRTELEEQTQTVFCKEEEVCEHLFRFLYDNDCLDKSLYNIDAGRMIKVIKGKSYPVISSKIAKSHLTVAGKNFATFDKLFLERLPRWQQLFKIRQRIIDPTVLFTDWENDESLPNLSTCKERAGFESEVSHNAVEDAIDVVRLLRVYY